MFELVLQGALEANLTVTYQVSFTGGTASGKKAMKACHETQVTHS